MGFSLIGALVSGIEAIGAGIAAFGTGLAADIGITGAIGADIGLGLEGAAAGAALGGIEGLVTHGNIGEDIGLGALTGGLTGGLSPLLSPLFGTTATDLLLGAGTGALGSVLTHQNPLTGALVGGAEGFLSGALTSNTGAATGTSPGAAAGGAGGISAGAIAAPPGVPIQSPDITDPNAPSSLIVGNAPTGISIDAPSGVASNVPGSFGVGAAAPGGSSNVTGAPAADAGAAAATPAGSPNLSPTDVGLGPLASSLGLNPVGSAGITAGAGTGAATGTSPGGIAGGVGGLLKSAPELLGLGGLAFDALKGNKQLPDQKVLQAEAAQLLAQGNQMKSSALAGVLPPGEQAGLNAAEAAADAAVRSNYAARGMGASSAEYTDISNISIETAVQAATLANQLFSQGVTEQNQADSLYQELLQLQIQQDNNLSASIGNLVGAMTKMGQPLTPTTPAG